MMNLEYYIHDEPRVLRIEIIGDLTGARVANPARLAHRMFDPPRPAACRRSHGSCRGR